MHFYAITTINGHFAEDAAKAASAKEAFDSATRAIINLSLSANKYREPNRFNESRGQSLDSR